MDATHHPLNSPTLLNLPAELFLRIVYFVHPSCHLNLACICKLLAHQSQGILTRHREAVSTNAHYSHGLHDLFPKMLSDVLSNPINAWHMRSFTSWVTRRLGPEVQLTRIGGRSCEEVLEEKFSLSGEQLRNMHQQLHEDCSDGPLKLLLYALNPYMRDLCFSRADQGDGDEA